MRRGSLWIPRAAEGGLFSVLLAVVPAEASSVASLGRLPVAIGVHACVRVSLPDLQRVISAELGIDVSVRPAESESSRELSTEPTRSSAADDPNLTRVYISCTEQLLRLDVLDSLSGKRLARHLQLSSPQTRTRMLGLSVAELIAASWLELGGRPEPRPHIVERKGSPRSQERALTLATDTFRPPSHSQLEAIFAVQRVDSTDLTALGGGLGASFAYRGWLVVGGDVLVHKGERKANLGTLDALLTSGSVSLRMRQELDRFAIEGGLGARVGFARLEGIPRALTPTPIGSTAWRPWWGPMLTLGLSTSLSRDFAVAVGIEVGRVMWAIEGRAEERAELSIENEWVGLTLRPALVLGD